MRTQKRNRYKLLLIAISSLLIQSAYGQMNIIAGKYKNISSYINSLSLNTDSTFNFRSKFSILGTYVNGIWEVHKDTIYLKAIIKEKRPKTLNWEYLNLSVSSDKRSIIYTKEPISFPYESDYDLPKILFYKNKKLYVIDEIGKIEKDNLYKREK